jgi:hypothetical protein
MKRGQQRLAGPGEAVLAAVGLLVERQPGQPTVVAVGPGVVRAAEVRGVAQLGPAHLHAAVQAHVEHHPDHAGLVPGHDERVGQDPADHVVTGIGDLGLVRQEHPGPGEEPVAFGREDLRVGVDVRRDHAAAHLADHGG